MPTTDEIGNLATDGGALIRQIGSNTAGVAIALASQAPDLTGSEEFGMRLNYANFDGEGKGISFNAAGVLARNVINEGDRIVFDVGVSYGDADDFNGDRQEVYGSRVGMQWSW